VVYYGICERRADFCDKLIAIFKDNLKNTRITIETVGMLLSNSVFDLYMDVCDKYVCARALMCKCKYEW